VPGPKIPIACTLGPDEVGPRLREFHELFASQLRTVQREPTRLRLVLDADDTVEVATRDLLAREQRCCAFFTFDLARSGATLTVDVRVPPSAARTLDGLAWLAGIAKPQVAS